MNEIKMTVKHHVKTPVRECRSCDFFEDYTKNHHAVIGFCRRYPPVPISDDNTRPTNMDFAKEAKSHNFPWVHKQCWCGEYVKRGMNNKTTTTTATTKRG